MGYFIYKYHEQIIAFLLGAAFVLGIFAVLTPKKSFTITKKNHSTNLTR